MAMNEYNIKALQELLSQPEDDCEYENDDLPQAGARKLGPDEIRSSNYVASPHTRLEDPAKQDIWNTSEATSVQVVEDPRQVPEYKMKFKQTVGTEDVYFGMGFKTPGTASCESLVILVKLPMEIRDKIELSVEADKVDLRSPKYRLLLPTPFTVDPNSSSAKWHSDSSTLEITLKLQRELDDINF